MKRYFERRSRQRGFSLITAVIFLVVLTFLAVTAIQVSIVDEKMAGNTRDEALALEAAEAALREAENFLSSAGLPSFTGTGIASRGLYDAVGKPWSGRADTHHWSGWTEDPATSLSFRVLSVDLARVAQRPRYLIERLPSVPSDVDDSLKQGDGTGEFKEVFRITARGTGGTTRAVAVLESTFWR